MRIGVRRPFLVAVGRVLLLWVEGGRLTHVPELFVTAQYTGETMIRTRRAGYGGLEWYKAVGSLFSGATLVSLLVRSIPGRYRYSPRLATGHGSGVCEPTDACAHVGLGTDGDVTESPCILVVPGAFGFLLSPSFD